MLWIGRKFFCFLSTWFDNGFIPKTNCGKGCGKSYAELLMLIGLKVIAVNF